MDFTKDPNDRRRVDAETQRQRDAEVARLRAARVPFREIGRRLGMSLGAVQKALRRHQKRSGAAKQEQRELDELDTELGGVLAEDDWLWADEVADRPELWYRLNPLERYRLHHQLQARAWSRRGHHLPPVHDEDHKWCCVMNGIDPDWQPAQHGTVSWREHCDRAMAGDSGTDDDW